MNRWLIIGSSRSAPFWFDAAYSHVERSMTANAGVFLFLCRGMWPHYIWMTDWRAIPLFGCIASYLQQFGSNVITYEETAGMVLKHGIRPDIILPESTPRYSLSGLCMTQFAIDNGAGAVQWCGLDGFVPNMPAYFDGRKVPINYNMRKNEEEIRAPLQAIIDANPDVQFEMYGDPLYQLDRVRTAADCAAEWAKGVPA